MRVFLDTNVLASAFGTRGVCSDLFRDVVEHHQLLTSEHVLSELRRVLISKFRMPAALVRERIEFLKPFQIVESLTELPEVELRDPDDIHILAAAIAAAADVLVTGDKHLLALNSRLPLKIVDPRGFLAML